MLNNHLYTVGIVVAHPDDEILWAGGTLLMHRDWRCSVYTLCRADDPDRAPKFSQVLARLGAGGRMANLDDSPEQHPLPISTLEHTICEFTAERSFDLLLTHGPRGEYTQHRRHDEANSTVLGLWASGQIRARELWMFAYHDEQRAHLPIARADADIAMPLPYGIWEEKYRLIRDVYGFSSDSWEARTTPATEAFWRLTSPDAAGKWLSQEEEL